MRRRALYFLAIVFSCTTFSRADKFAVLPADQGDLSALFNTATRELSTGDYQKAAADLEKLLSLFGEASLAGADANLEPVYFTLGAAYFNLPQYGKAIEIFKKYQETYPKSARLPDVTFSMGQAALYQKNNAEAAEQFHKLENIPIYRDEALYYGAYALKDSGNVDGAISCLEKLISPDIKSETSARGAMMLAGLYVDKKQFDKANALIQHILRKSEFVDNIIRLNSLAVDLGDRMMQENHPADALSAYRAVRSRAQVIAFESDRVRSFETRLDQNVAAIRANPSRAIDLVSANNKVRRAIAETKKMEEDAKRLPVYAPAIYFRIGQAYYEMDKKWEAIVAYNYILAQYPEAKEREAVLFADIVAHSEVNRPLSSRKLCEQYLKEFPKGKNAETAGYLLGATALQSGDQKFAATLFGRMLEEQPDSSFRGEMRFLLANAEFSQGEFEKSERDFSKYGEEFPNGAHQEEANYRVAVGKVFAGKYEEAVPSLNAYLTQYPHGAFRADAKYRLMVCKYAAQHYDEIISDAAAWRTEFPRDPMTGEVLALVADALAAQGKYADAIPVYIESYKKATTDEVLNYSLFEAGKLLQKLGKWDDISKLYEEFVKSNPSHPTVVVAMSWISKALTHEGKNEEAKLFLVEQLKNYINDPSREAVEQLLQQLVQLCSKRPRVTESTSPSNVRTVTKTSSAAQSPTPAIGPSATPLPPYDSASELNKQLTLLGHDANATGKARLLYARAELATLQKKPNEHDDFIGEIAKQYSPTDLSPLLLAQVGDYLLAKGDYEKAGTYYAALKDIFPKSSYRDYAYVGLGEIAFSKKDYQAALGLFVDGADNFAGAKIKEATIGKAKTLVELGHYNEARDLFEQIATVREWRGESTAYAVYSLGEIEERQGHWAEAIAYYQRVFVLHQRYLPWVAKCYIKAAESFEKLGKRQEAIAHLKEMLRNDKLQNFPETKQAKQMLEQWSAT